MNTTQNNLSSIERSRNVPQLRFPEFSDDWKKCRIGDTFKLFNGYAFSSSDSLNSDGALWVKIADVGIDKMKTDNLSYLPYEYVEKYKKFVLNEGDYVVALTRPILSGNLKIARIDEYFNNSLLNQRVAKLITDNNSSFIYNLLKGDRLIKSIENNIAGSDPPNLSPNDINHIKITIPKLPEQEKIASFLTDVDDKITKLTKKKTLLEQYKKGIMQKIFNQELRFKDDEGNVFPDWEVKKLGEVAIKQSSNISANTIEDNVGDYKIYGASGLLKKIDFYREKEPYISIVKDGAGVGRTLLCDAYSSVLGTLDIIKPKKGVNLYFIYCLLNNLNFLKFITGSTIPHIYFKDYSTVKIKIPSLEEQTKIANFLSDIDVKIEALNTKIENSKSFKKGLLQKMFV